LFVIISKYGRLANRLFTFAHVISCAIESQVGVVNLALGEYAQFFQGTSRDLWCRYPARASALAGCAALREWLCSLVSAVVPRRGGSAVRIGGRTITVLDRGALQAREQQPAVIEPSFFGAKRGKQIVVIREFCLADRLHFIRHADEIRRYFAPLPVYQENAGAAARTAREGAEILVGVHVRRGDYQEWCGGRYFFGPEQYGSVMGQVGALLGDRRVAFLVCSNEKEVRLPALEYQVAFGTGHPIEDLYSLAHCDYVVGPPSTYSQWASFYGEAPLYTIQDPSATIARNSFQAFDDSDAPHLDVGRSW